MAIFKANCNFRQYIYPYLSYTYELVYSVILHTKSDYDTNMFAYK